MKSKKMLIAILLVSLFTMVLAPLTTAQTGSLVVWENIAGGTLTSTWLEKSDSNWSPGEIASGGVYNCSTSGINWTTPTGAIFGDKGHRWYATYEAKVDDSNLGVGLIYAYESATSWSGWLYILEDRWDANPGFYLVRNNAGTIQYKNATWTTNMSLATDYSNNVEKDYLNSYCRFKSIYNGYNHSLQVKIWDPTGDEPIPWLFDSHSTTIKSTASNNMSCGLLTVCGDGESDKAIFRRIFFWNLSYDLYGATTKPKIVCPTYDAMTFYNLLITLVDEDLWNSTQYLRGFFNSWDLTSFYTNDMFITTKTNQNDTTYVFTNMLTDFVEFWETMYPANPLPPEAPDNTLTMNIYQTTDGTNYGEADDYMLIRIDSDNNGAYDSYDYAFWVNATGVIMGRFYQGWTELTDPEWYGILGESWNDPGDYGELFRDDGYHVWSAFINWDLLYNGSSHQRIGSDLCRMSVAFYDKNSTNLTIGQDFNESNDRTMKSPSEKHNGLLTPTWFGWNTTTSWFYFQVDESLSGEPLADPEDSVYDAVDPTTKNIVQVILPILLAIAILIFIISMAFTGGLTKENLIALMIIAIIGVIVIQIILSL